MEEDSEFSIRVHAGENPIFENNVRDALEIIYREHEKLEEETGREIPMPKVRNPNIFVKDFSLDKLEEYIMQAKLEVDLTPENMLGVSEQISDFYHVARDENAKGKDNNEIGDED